MQAAENRFSGPGITVRLLDCFSSPHLATTQQGLNCQVAHVRAVKQLGCLRSSVRRSIIFGPYWLIKSETRYWETSCHLIPAWMSNHMHLSMEWNYLILISIPKLQRLHLWRLVLDKEFQHTFYNGWNYSSMQGLKLSNGPQLSETPCLWNYSPEWPRGWHIHMTFVHFNCL